MYIITGFCRKDSGLLYVSRETTEEDALSDLLSKMAVGWQYVKGGYSDLILLAPEYEEPHLEDDYVRRGGWNIHVDEVDENGFCDGAVIW